MAARVVIVDDAAFIREVLAQLLVPAGFEIVGEAADGAEAVDIVLREKPDVVIMDIVMPVKSGIQAATEILEKLPEMKIIACSTEGSETMVLKALEAGCCDYVIKPFLANDLVKQLKRIVGGVKERSSV